MNIVNWGKISKKYRGLWISLKEDKKDILASGKSVKEVMERSAKKGNSDPVIFRVPTKVFPYVGLFL